MGSSGSGTCSATCRARRTSRSAGPPVTMSPPGGRGRRPATPRGAAARCSVCSPARPEPGSGRYTGRGSPAASATWRRSSATSSRTSYACAVRRGTGRPAPAPRASLRCDSSVPSPRRTTHSAAYCRWYVSSLTPFAATAARTGSGWAASRWKWARRQLERTREPHDGEREVAAGQFGQRHVAEVAGVPEVGVGVLVAAGAVDLARARVEQTGLAEQVEADVGQRHLLLQLRRATHSASRCAETRASSASATQSAASSPASTPRARWCRRRAAGPRSRCPWRPAGVVPCPSARVR